MYKSISSNKKSGTFNRRLNLINGILVRKKSLYREVKGFLQFLYKIYRIFNQISNNFELI
jgi:hypothetical protein